MGEAFSRICHLPNDTPIREKAAVRRHRVGVAPLPLEIQPQPEYADARHGIGAKERHTLAGMAPMGASFLHVNLLEVVVPEAVLRVIITARMNVRRQLVRQKWFGCVPMLRRRNIA